MHIEFIDSDGLVTYEINPTVSYESFCNFMDFPEPSFEPEMSVISHRVRIVCSLELFYDEYEVTAEIEKQLHQKYKIDSSLNMIEIAELEITEFPNEWKDRMKFAWGYWLDALDGDHAVIGTRADEIEERNLYDNPLELGDLFYIRTLLVHPRFRGNKLGIRLIQYTFNYLIRDRIGMVFVIAQEPYSEERKRNRRPLELVKYYESIGFIRAFSSKNVDRIMEVEVNTLRTK